MNISDIHGLNRVSVVIGSVLLIVLFWSGNGIISEKIFQCKAIMWISSYSMEIYFMHYPILNVFKYICNFSGIILLIYTVSITLMISISLKSINDVFIKICSKRWNWNWVTISK